MAREAATVRFLAYKGREREGRRVTVDGPFAGRQFQERVG